MGDHAFHIFSDKLDSAVQLQDRKPSRTRQTESPKKVEDEWGHNDGQSLSGFSCAQVLVMLALGEDQLAEAVAVEV